MAKDVSGIPREQRFFYAKLKRMKPTSRIRYSSAVLNNPEATAETKQNLKTVMNEQRHWFKPKDKRSDAESQYKVRNRDRSGSEWDFKEGRK